MASNRNPYICSAALPLHCVGNEQVLETAHDGLVHISVFTLVVLSFISKGIKLFFNKILGCNVGEKVGDAAGII